MARTAEEVKAEIEAMRLAGEHHMTAKMRGLRAELKEIEGPPEPKAVAADPEAISEVLPVEIRVRADLPPAKVLGGPLDSDEWRFLEKACAEVELQGAGNQTGVVKKFYNALWAKLTVWRIAREIVQQIGVGGEWPQWSTLGRDDSTGKKEDRKLRVLPPSENNTKPSNVTEMEMPILSRPSREEILAQVTGGDPRSGVIAEVAMRQRPSEVGV